MKATVEDAKALWNSTPDPNPSKIARMLSAAGKTISHMAIRRWLEKDWQVGRLENVTGAIKVAGGPDKLAPMTDIETVADDTIVEVAGREAMVVAGMALRKVRNRFRQNKAMSADELRAYGTFIKDCGTALTLGAEVFLKGLELRTHGKGMVDDIPEQKRLPPPVDAPVDVEFFHVGSELAEDMKRWDEGLPPKQANGNGAAGHAVSDG